MYFSFEGYGHQAPSGSYTMLLLNFLLKSKGVWPLKILHCVWLCFVDTVKCLATENSILRPQIENPCAGSSDTGQTHQSTSLRSISAHTCVVTVNTLVGFKIQFENHWSETFFLPVAFTHHWFPICCSPPAHSSIVYRLASAIQTGRLLNPCVSHAKHVNWCYVSFWFKRKSRSRLALITKTNCPN